MMLVTMSQFARLAGVNQATISKNLSGPSNHALKQAAKGKKIDAEHPEARKYIETKQKERLSGERPMLAKDRAAPNADPQSKNVATLEEIPENIRELADKSLRELVKRFGTDSNFTEWLKAVKMIEDIAEKHIKNAILRGELIPRKFVSENMFSIIESSNVRLLNDSPGTIAAMAIEIHEAGGSLEEVEVMVRGKISDQIKAVKAQAKKALKNV